LIAVFRLRNSSPCPPRVEFQIQPEDLLATRKQTNDQVVKKIIYLITLTLPTSIAIRDGSKSTPIDGIMAVKKNWNYYKDGSALPGR